MESIHCSGILPSIMRIAIALVALLAFAAGGWYVFGTNANAKQTGSAIDVFGYSQTQQAASANATQPLPSTTNDNEKTMQATLHTNLGDITIEFIADAPNTVANFQKLASANFYNGTKFHRVIKGFMIQGGDPLTKDDALSDRWGTGDPGYKFADEIHPKNHNDAGTISMANSGPNTNGSQFFINVAPNNFLDSKHTVFGKVVAGMDVVTKIENTPTAPGDRPLTPVVIESVTLSDL
jgi:peptidylprolyl isomerase